MKTRALPTIALLISSSFALANPPASVKPGAKPAPVFDAKRYGDLFVASGKAPGIRSLVVGTETWQKVQIVGMMSTGEVQIQTQQGKKIVALEKLPPDWVKAVQAQEAARVASLPVDVDAMIRLRAAVQFPTDPKQQATEVKKQKDALATLNLLGQSQDPKLLEILAAAKLESPEDFDLQVHLVKAKQKK